MSPCYSLKGLWGVALLALVLLTGCQPEGTFVPQTSFAGFVVPVHFPKPVYNNSANPITPDGFALGKKIFYDKNLSADKTISCGSCHAQGHAFGDHQTKTSQGIAGRLGKRNSPAIFNMAWNSSFMWDGGINHLEIMPVAPFTDTTEMGMPIQSILDYLQSQPEYVNMFDKAFGSRTINDKKMLLALAQFMTAMVSADSKYDQYILGKSSLQPDETRGLALFRTHCATCHNEPLFTNFEFINNGIGLHSEDPGRARITLDEKDKGKFKVPSLRNVALTSPYMHHGALRTLEDVLDHYSSPISIEGNVDLRVAGGLSLTASDKEDLIAFLNTLSDYTLLANPAFADPN